MQSKQQDKAKPVEPRPCLGYTASVRVEHIWTGSKFEEGETICMGCDKYVKDHPIANRTMSEPKEQL